MHTCQYCNKKFSHASTLTRHVKENRCAVLTECTEIFAKNSELKKENENLRYKVQKLEMEARAKSVSNHNVDDSFLVKTLKEKIKQLEKEIQIQKNTRTTTVNRTINHNMNSNITVNFNQGMYIAMAACVIKELAIKGNLDRIIPKNLISATSRVEDITDDAKNIPFSFPDISRMIADKNGKTEHEKQVIESITPVLKPFMDVNFKNPGKIPFSSTNFAKKFINNTKHF